MWVFLDDNRESPLVVHNDKRGLGMEIGKSNKWVYARNYQTLLGLREISNENNQNHLLMARLFYMQNTRYLLYI